MIFTRFADPAAPLSDINRDYARCPNQSYSFEGNFNFTLVNRSRGIRERPASCPDASLSYFFFFFFSFLFFSVVRN